MLHDRKLYTHFMVYNTFHGNFLKMFYYLSLGKFSGHKAAI